MIGPPIGINRRHPLARNLLVWWQPIDGLFNPLILWDLSGNNNHGTIVNRPAMMAEPTRVGHGRVQTFNTSFQYIQNLAMKGLPFAANQPFTLLYGHRTRTVVTYSHALVLGAQCHLNNSDGQPVDLGTIRGIFCRPTISFWVANSDWDTGLVWPTGSNPNLLAFTFDGSYLRFYKDGVLAAGPVTDTVSSMRVTKTSLVVHGRAYWTPSINGPDADFLLGAVWSRCLSDAEIAGVFGLWNRGLPGLLTTARSRPGLDRLGLLGRLDGLRPKWFPGLRRRR